MAYKVFKVALFFPPLRVLSHWVFPDEVFNEAINTQIPYTRIRGNYSMGSVVINYV